MTNYIVTEYVDTIFNDFNHYAKKGESESEIKRKHHRLLDSFEKRNTSVKEVDENHFLSICKLAEKRNGTVTHNGSKIIVSYMTIHNYRYCGRADGWVALSKYTFVFEPYLKENVD